MFAGVKCCNGLIFGAAMIMLCFVDWLHVILAMAFMFEEAFSKDGNSAGATVCALGWCAWDVAGR